MMYTINEGMFMTLMLALGQNKYVCISAWTKLGTVGQIKILFFFLTFIWDLWKLCQFCAICQYLFNFDNKMFRVGATPR